MTHILIHSNGPAIGTGYGTQTRLIAERLKKAGYGVTISAFYGREGAPSINDHGIMELPRVRDPFGNDVIAAHAQFCKADIILSLTDPFALDPLVWGELPWAAWTPVDCAPVLPLTAEVLKSARWVIAMSRFGEAQLRGAGFEDVIYMPHAIETEVFKPSDRQKARQQLGEWVQADLHDKFIVVTVAANKDMPSRKNFDGMFAAFAQFAHAHPDAVFYVHTELQGIWSGEDLRVMVQAYGLADKVFFPPQYPLVTGMIAPTFLNIVYNAGDVFLLLSRGEGFGLPIVEAQAAGCPVIVTDFSAMPELVFAGVTVPSIPIMAATGYWQRLALVPAAAEALAWAYGKRGDVGLRAQARKGALVYDIETVMREYILPAMRTLEGDLLKKPMATLTSA